MKNIFFILLTSILVLTSCSNINKTKEETEDTSEKQEQATINTMVKRMSLEEKVGQLFMLDFRLNDANQPITQINSNMIEAIEKYHIGGIALFSENIKTPNQTKELIDNIQSHATIPLFIAVDEEGGMVSRIGNNPNMRETRLPNMNKIAKEDDPSAAAYEVGVTLGQELRKLHFNVDFAPVADVNTNPNNPVIGPRSFGADPHVVAQLIEREVIGLQRQNISACAKHFPGHGDTNRDSHVGKVSVNHTLKRLRQVEWVPFKAAIKAGVDFIMVGHINTPLLTKENVPASMSYDIVTTYLRGELGFDGIVITDALDMGAIKNQYSSENASVKAFEAGVDILLMPVDYKKAYAQIVSSIKTGRITEERLDESVKRILQTKMRFGSKKDN